MKLKIGILVAMLSMMLVGCTNEATKDPQDNTSNGNEVQENTGSENEKEDGNKDSENKGNENTKEETTIDFKIYTADVNDTDKIIDFETIKLKENTSVEEKLKELCAALEKDYFKDENAKIVFKSIDEKNIATIDLVNQEAWSQHFQGSTGGMISQATIVETLLQREYSGKWIDGLNVLVDGTSEELFEHAPFIGTFNRNK